jgi:hypothetical protein
MNNDILQWLKINRIDKYTINKDGSIDVNQDVSIATRPPVKFNIVKGYFDASLAGLISLDNFPRIIKGFLNISKNRLKNLDNFPEQVAWDIDLREIHDLENADGLLLCKANTSQFKYDDDIIEDVLKIKCKLEGVSFKKNSIIDAFGVFRTQLGI